MMLIAAASFKGSPMVTSFAVALATCWPVPGAVVLEADPSGGDLASRFGLSRHPGLHELAAAPASDADQLEVDRYTARLGVGVDVIPAPGDFPHGPAPGGAGNVGRAEMAVAAMAKRTAQLAQASAGRAIIADLGRLGWASPALPLAGAADRLLLLARSGQDTVDLLHARRELLSGLHGGADKARLILTGRSRSAAERTADQAGFPLAGVLPDDPRGLAVLTGRSAPRSGWTRLPLLRAACAIAWSLHTEQVQRAAVNREIMYAILLGEGAS